MFLSLKTQDRLHIPPTITLRAEPHPFFVPCVLPRHRVPRPFGSTVTAHRCKHIGYDEFDPPSWNSECAPDKADWIPDDDRLCGLDWDYPEVLIRVVLGSSGVVG